MLASGRVIDLAVAERADGGASEERIDEALLAFAQNTIEHAAEEVELLAGRDRLPAGADGRSAAATR